MGWNLVIECSIAAATAAAATAATTREFSGWLRRRAVTGAIRRAEHRKLNRVLLPRALRAGNLLRLVQNDLLKVRLTILANVFVDRHWRIITLVYSISITHLNNYPCREWHANAPEEKGTSHLPLPSTAAKRARVQASALNQFKITQCRGGGPAKDCPLGSKP